MARRWAVITGTSTGIGRAVALRLLRDGICVLAGVRKQSDGDSLAAEVSSLATKSTGEMGTLVPLLLDVSDPAALADATRRVEQTVESNGLWSLINNAGIAVPGPVEFVSLEGWRRQFDVNLFGAIALTQALLPLLRRGVATHGLHVPRVVIVSSIGGRIAQPVNAPYTCSKFAVSALGDCLRLELRRQGIGVTVLEPGAIATAIWGKGQSSSKEFGPEHPAHRLYGPELDGLAKLATSAAAGAMSPDRAAAALARVLHARRAPARVLLGRDAKVMAFLKQHLPTRLFDSILLGAYGVGQLPLHAPVNS